MKLILVAHRSGAAFEIADVGIVVGNYESSFELSCAGCVDTEIGRQLHRASYPFWDVNK